MGFSNEDDGLISKTKSMAFSLFNIISKASKFSSLIHFPNPSKHLQLIPSGLNIVLINARPNPKTESLLIHSYTIPPLPTISNIPTMDLRSLTIHSSHFSSSSTGMDDMLGTESGVYMSATELKVETNDCPVQKRTKVCLKKEELEEYPPVIPLLARTGKLTGHMPWILTRHYSNGRLVLKEEKVKHHEYFEAYRENGRLVLQLVPLDHIVTCCHSVCEENVGCEEQDQDQEEVLENVGFYDSVEENGEAEEEKEDDDKGDDDDDDDCSDGKRRSDMTMTSALSVPRFCHGNERYGDPRKCFTYSDVNVLQCW